MPRDTTAHVRGGQAVPAHKQSLVCVCVCEPATQLLHTWIRAPTTAAHLAALWEAHTHAFCRLFLLFLHLETHRHKHDNRTVTRTNTRTDQSTHTNVVLFCAFPSVQCIKSTFYHDITNNRQEASTLIHFLCLHLSQQARCVHPKKKHQPSDQDAVSTVVSAAASGRVSVTTPSDFCARGSRGSVALHSHLRFQVDGC